MRLEWKLACIVELETEFVYIVIYEIICVIEKKLSIGLSLIFSKVKMLYNSKNEEERALFEKTRSLRNWSKTFKIQKN